jgi:hypothetical protein
MHNQQIFVRGSDPMPHCNCLLRGSNSSWWGDRVQWSRWDLKGGVLLTDHKDKYNDIKIWKQTYINQFARDTLAVSAKSSRPFKMTCPFKRRSGGCYVCKGKKEWSNPPIRTISAMYYESPLFSVHMLDVWFCVVLTVTNEAICLSKCCLVLFQHTGPGVTGQMPFPPKSEQPTISFIPIKFQALFPPSTAVTSILIIILLF